MPRNIRCTSITSQQQFPETPQSLLSYPCSQHFKLFVVESYYTGFILNTDQNLFSKVSTEEAS